MKRVVAVFVVVVLLLLTGCNSVSGAGMTLPDDVDFVVYHGWGNGLTRYYVREYSVACGVLVFQGFWRPQGSYGEYGFIPESRTFADEWRIERK
ncbi:MAG: hypothetical protein ACUZ8A_06745 [Candidatus Bathyanammoxibius sp.]